MRLNTATAIAVVDHVFLWARKFVMCPQRRLLADGVFHMLCPGPLTVGAVIVRKIIPFPAWHWLQFWCLLFLLCIFLG